MATWILLGTPIAIYSPTKKSAMCNIFQILRGDAGHILLDSILTNGVYGRAFIVGWTVFAFLSPIMAYFAWITRERGLFPKIIGAGIVLVSVYQAFSLYAATAVSDLLGKAAAGVSESLWSSVLRFAVVRSLLPDPQGLFQLFYEETRSVYKAGAPLLSRNTYPQ